MKMRENNGDLLHGETHDESDAGEDHTDEPEPHDDGLF